MDEDEMESVLQSQVESDDWFGSASYVSPSGGGISGSGVGHGRSVKAFQDAVLTDTDSSAEEDDLDFGDDTSSNHSGHDTSSPRYGRSHSSTVSMMGGNGQIGDLPSGLSPSSTFVAARTAQGGRTGSPLISSARAKSVSNTPPPSLPEPPPSLPSLPQDDEPPPSLGDPSEAPPPRLPDLPELPVLRSSSHSLRVEPGRTVVDLMPGILPPPLTIPAYSLSPGTSPLSPVSPNTPSPRERASSHMGLMRKSNSGSVKKPSLYNPASLPNGVLQGELHLNSPQLPFGTWVVVECSLIGTQLRWLCKNPECYSLIELSTVTKVTRAPKQVPEGLPAGYSSFYVKTATEQYHIGASAAETSLLWKDAIEYHAPKKASSGSGKKKKSKDKSALSTAALAMVKTRLDVLAPVVSTATYNLIRLFFHGKYTFIKAIFAVIQSADVDKVSASLARMFFFAEIPLQLIKSVIEWEVDRTDVVNSLFRQDSIASKIMTAYTRLIAQPYLVSTLKESLTKIAKCGKELEVNPDALNPEEREAVGTRVFLLQSVVTELLVAIRESIANVPTECRLICSFLNEAVSRKFNDPKATEIALAGYLFLRLINSAIVVPDSIGIVEKSSLTPEGRRSLTVVSKIILNMANQVEFHKEPYMIPFNSFLREKLPIIQAFIQDCVQVPPDAWMTETSVPPPQLILDELALIYKILYPLQDKLAATLASEPKVLKRMKQAFTAIGAPPAAQTASSQPSLSDSKDGKKDKKASSGPIETPKKAPLPPQLMHFASKSQIQ